MTTPVPLVVGKYALLGQDSSTYDTSTGQVVIVIEHKVASSGSGKSLTTVAVVKDMDAAKSIARDAHAAGEETVAPALLRMDAALKFTDLTNRALSVLMGAGKWKVLLDASTPVLKPAAAPDVSAEPDPAAGSFGKTFVANIPIIESDSITMVEGTWKIVGRDCRTM